MATNNLGVLKMTTLEKSVGKTLVGKYAKSIEKFFVDNFQTPGNEPNFYLPDLFTVCNELSPKLSKDYVELYNKCFGIYDGVTEIPDKIKITQASLIDGLMFGYKTTTGDVSLYTLNVNTLFNLGVDEEVLYSKAMDLNKVGSLYAFRIDVEYTDEEEFTFKAVKLNKNTFPNCSDFYFFPYITISKSMAMIAMLLNQNVTIEAVQTLSGVTKVRYITKSKKVLARYCDVPKAVEDVGMAFFPLKAFFYAPVLGAPSYTAMVTKVNLFQLDRMSAVRSASEIKVKKPKSSSKQLIGNNEVVRAMSKLYTDNPYKYGELLEELPRSEEILNGVESPSGETVLKPELLSKYLNSLSEKDLERVYQIIPGVTEEIEKKCSLMSNYEIIDPTSLDNDKLRELLKNGVYNIIIRKKDCSLSSIVCTNSPKILSQIYGNDYFGRLEGFNIRFAELVEELTLGRPIEESLKYCGFASDEDILNKVKALEKKAKLSGATSFKDELEAMLVKSSGVKKVSRSNTSNILVRKCFAEETIENGVEDYYRYVDINKIQKIVKLS